MNFSRINVFPEKNPFVYFDTAKGADVLKGPFSHSAIFWYFGLFR